MVSLYDEKQLILEEPLQHVWNDMQNKLTSGCNKQQLLRYADAFVPWLKNYDKIYMKRSDGSIMEANELSAMVNSNSSKYVIASGVSLILASNENLQSYIDTLKPELCELWRKVLLFGYISHEKAKEILGIKNDLFNTNSSYYYFSSTTWNKREYGWFVTSRMRSSKMEYGYRKYDDFITVNNAVRGIFFPCFFPELKVPDLSCETLPEGQWHTIEFETESQSSFNLFSGLFKQGALPMKKKGITTADIKRADKKVGLTEFFPNDHNEYREHLRAYNYMSVLGIYEHQKPIYMAKKVMSYPDTLLNIFKNFDKFNHYLPQLLYPHIKGLRQNQIQWGNHDQLCHYMLQWLKDHPNNWVKITEIYLRIVELGSDGTKSINTAMVYNPNEEQNTTEIINLYTNKGIGADSYAREFGYNGLKAFGFILASLGIAEIAMPKHPTAISSTSQTSDNTLQQKDNSPFAPLEYIRLTPLGNYALGLTKHYDAPELKQEAYFELDPERLIIRSLQDPNPYEQLLRDTATPISRGRFQTSALSFLSNCYSREDVEGKINVFKQFIANELPPLWEQFFQSLLQHCHPLQEDTTSYKHYTLQPDNRDLINLITTDPVLRQLAIRAEGYRILVKTEDLRKFVNQLKKHGYLL